LNYPFPSFVQRVINRVENFEIWGDGSQVRDFIHIDDIVAATMHFVDNDIELTVNLGWGLPVSFNDLAEKFFEVSGWRPRNGITHLLDKPKGVMFRCSDNSRMLEHFKPKISLEQGIADALERGSHAR
jgi:nucleoside-diphosphate-sugar epimerase